MGKLSNQLAGHAGDERHRLLDDNNELSPGGVPTPTLEELNHSVVAPGRAAQLPWCIAYHAFWKEEADGMARHAREQVRALAMTGLPVRLQSLGQQIILNEDLPPEVQELSYLEGISSTSTAISIKHIVFNKPGWLREAICAGGIRNSFSSDVVQRICRSTIIYTSWERDKAHPQFVEELNTLGQLWVPCEANREAFVLSGMSPDRVKVVPCPYDPANHSIAAPRGSDQVPPGKRFYHIGKWEPRKNQHRLLGAFFLAYTPKDKASLLIKTSEFGHEWSGYPPIEESLRFWLEDERVRRQGWTSEHVDRLVRIISKKIPLKDLEKLHAMNNIYVSSGLGEAWDLPAFDAKLAGNRLVYVGYGGPGDYAEAEDVAVPWDEFTEVHPGYLWEPEAQWASVSVDQLATALKEATPVEERLVPRRYCQKYSRFAVGERMKLFILELAQELGCLDQLRNAGGFG